MDRCRYLRGYEITFPITSEGYPIEECTLHQGEKMETEILYVLSLTDRRKIVYWEENRKMSESNMEGQFEINSGGIFKEESI